MARTKDRQSASWWRRTSLAVLTRRFFVSCRANVRARAGQGGRATRLGSLVASSRFAASSSAVICFRGKLRSALAFAAPGAAICVCGSHVSATSARPNPVAEKAFVLVYFFPNNFAWSSVIGVDGKIVLITDGDRSKMC
jgi:hypothetical protein